MIKRLSRFTGNNQDDLLKAVQERVSEFCEHPTLRDIADYILVDAHHNYHAKDPEFMPVENVDGNTAWIVNNYGTPRELEPALETPFQGEYKINPYQGYRERAKECKDTYSDSQGYMAARIAKVIPNPSGGYIYELSEAEEIKLTQTMDSYWWHTDVSHFEKIWDHIQVLYTDLTHLVSTDTHNKLIGTKTELISQIGWWYFQVMPYTRGSGAIGISLLQSLFDYSGIINPPYKEATAPDLEAFVTPLPHYMKNFAGFYSGKMGTSKS